MATLYPFNPGPTFDAAMAQQVALCAMAYMDDPDGATQLIAPTGAINVNDQRPDNYLPSMMVVSQPPKRYFVAIAGTTLTTQGLAQGSAYNVQTHYRDEGEQKSYVGLYWKRAYDELLEVLKINVPLDDPELEIYFSGHSYGGAVALLAGLEFARLHDRLRVQTMTFGQPRTFSHRVQGPFPWVCERVYHPDDLVPNYPADGPSLTLNTLLAPSSWVWSRNNFTHYGRETELAGETYLEPLGRFVWSKGPQAYLIGLEAHSLFAYGVQIRERLRNSPSDPAGSTARADGLDAIERAFASMRRQTAKKITPLLQQKHLSLPADVLTAYQARLGDDHSVTPFTTGGPLMAVKHTWLFFDRLGAFWTETYSKADSAATSSLANIPPELIQARLAFLSNTCVLHSIRASEIDGNRSSDTRKINLAGLSGNNQTDPTPDITSSAAVWTIRGNNSTKRKIWFRGLSDTVVRRVSATGQDELLGVAREQMLDFITQAGVHGYGIISRGKPREGTNFEWRALGIVDGTAGGTRCIITVSSTTDWDKDDYIYVSLVNQKQLPGLKGIFRLKTQPVGTTVEIEYRTPQAVQYTGVGGRARLIAPVAVQTFRGADSEFSHFGHRQTNKRFSGSRGARRAVRLRRSV